MLSFYLAEFSISYKPVRHGRPGIGATTSESNSPRSTLECELMRVMKVLDSFPSSKDGSFTGCQFPDSTLAIPTSKRTLGCERGGERAGQGSGVESIDESTADDCSTLGVCVVALGKTMRLHRRRDRLA